VRVDYTFQSILFQFIKFDDALIMKSSIVVICFVNN
jgi:hypothetical protein